MAIQLAKPSSILAKYIKQYWAIENCLKSGEHFVNRVVPTGLPELMFFFENSPLVDKSGKEFNDSVILSGQQNDFFDITVTGNLSMFSVTFTPHGISRLYGFPQHEIFNRNISLKLLFNREISVLENKLYDANSFQDKVTMMNAYLLKRLERQTLQNEKRLNYCLDLIKSSKGLIGINELASGSCLSRKQFERIFISGIGAPPKKFLKIIRFQSLLNEKKENKKLSLTELAFICGYFDQSHMIREFKSMTGLVPSEYFSICEPHSDFFV